eukprot:scaffold46293_cov70-Phaeocystis_antarctica.AAC.5
MRLKSSKSSSASAARAYSRHRHLLGRQLVALVSLVALVVRRGARRAALGRLHVALACLRGLLHASEVDRGLH